MRLVGDYRRNVFKSEPASPVTLGSSNDVSILLCFDPCRRSVYEREESDLALRGNRSHVLAPPRRVHPSQTRLTSFCLPILGIDRHFCQLSAHQVQISSHHLLSPEVSKTEVGLPPGIYGVHLPTLLQVYSKNICTFTFLDVD